MQGNDPTASETYRNPATADRASARRGAARTRLCGHLALLSTLAFMTTCVSPTQPAHDSLRPARHHAEPEPARAPISATPALDLSATSDLENVVSAIADRRVVLIGETHSRFDHHLTQLEIIRRLDAIHPKMAIGMEVFEQPFQRHLDDYVAGELSQRELLRKTEYYQRWGFDFRLYEPILSYAREQRLPVVALNLPGELTKKVGQGGIDALTDEERGSIPDEIDRSDAAYEQRLKEIFDQHPHGDGLSFDRFLEVQLLWDEGMAQRAASYLESHPESAMVILAGSGHLAYGSGIPRRLVRRIPVSTAIVLNDWGEEPGPELGDFLLLPRERDLPEAGRIGALLEEDEDGVRILSCTSGSPCETTGLEPGDQISSIDDQPVTSVADLRVVMWDKSPGDAVTMEIRRKRWLSEPKELTYGLVLR